MIIIYITNPTKEKAKEIAKHLLDKKLIACANLIDSNSLYKWEGELKDENEVILLAKTTEDKFEEVKKEVKKIHPYDIPCILKIPAEANKEYSEWLEK
ncbi:divalent-cation tolerance protein CutA [Candidatus Woesearchaeota archaeon]|nr:divalent-cation tolerance protein CutA [Candidatus Woesearchaeota archaeon]